ncbi:epidermal growth factor receptor kinase substrate 8-like protein 2 [Symphorus nematophorus]
MTNISRFLVNHLLTFSLQDGDVQGVEEAQARLSFLAQNKKLWSQQMFLDVGAEAIHLRDIQSQDELEKYSFKSIYRCDAINTEKHFPSLLLLVCQSADQKKPDIHFFNCETVKAEEICDDIAHAVSATSRSKKLTDSPRYSEYNGHKLQK